MNKQSLEAFAGIKPRINKMHEKILNVIEHSIGAPFVGATTDEIEVALNLKHQTASARMCELKKYGLIEKAGTRPTRSGYAAGVYILKEDNAQVGQQQLC